MALSRNPEFPLDPSFNIRADGGITVDRMLKEPTRITRFIADRVNDNLLSEKLYSSTTVSGGILMYNQITSKINTETKLRTGIVAPGGEFPEIDQSDVTEEFTKVQKVGGKVTITDEAVKRNQDQYLRQQLINLSNRIITDLDQDAVDAFELATGNLGSDMPAVESNGWVKSNNTKAADHVPAQSIAADLSKLRLKAKQIDLGYNYTTLLVNPEDFYELGLAVGINQEAAYIGQFGWTVEQTNHVPRGTAWLLAPKQLGTIGVESPISTESWRDEAHQTHHTQTWATVGHAITDPFALIKLTGTEKSA